MPSPPLSASPLSLDDGNRYLEELPECVSEITGSPDMLEGTYNHLFGYGFSSENETFRRLIMRGVTMDKIARRERWLGPLLVNKGHLRGIVG